MCVCVCVCVRAIKIQDKDGAETVFCRAGSTVWLFHGLPGPRTPCVLESFIFCAHYTLFLAEFM